MFVGCSYYGMVVWNALTLDTWSFIKWSDSLSMCLCHCAQYFSLHIILYGYQKYIRNVIYDSVLKNHETDLVWNRSGINWFDIMATYVWHYMTSYYMILLCTNSALLFFFTLIDIPTRLYAYSFTFLFRWYRYEFQNRTHESIGGAVTWTTSTSIESVLGFSCVCELGMVYVVLIYFILIYFVKIKYGYGYAFCWMMA